MKNSPSQQHQKPFLDHLLELRRRLVVCVLFIAIGSGIGYAIHQDLLKIIQAPLGEKLYFTSPTGGFNFIFALCLGFGLLVALPCIIYQILAFLRPALPEKKQVKLFWYPFFSAILASLGILFAYFISLPAALHFLTNFGGDGIESLITTDSYFRFALAYLIGFAVLFQLPLLLIAINRITPLQPKKLMKGQKYIIVGSFLVAAILTPTPDPFNQLLMAGPIIILYQVSILLVWMINIRKPSPRVTLKTTRVIPKTLPSTDSPQPKPAQNSLQPNLIRDIARAPTAHAIKQRNLQPVNRSSSTPQTRPSSTKERSGPARWASGGFIDIVNATR